MKFNVSLDEQKYFFHLWRGLGLQTPAEVAVKHPAPHPQKYIWGGPSKFFWSFRYPKKLLSYCIFTNKFSKFGVLGPKKFHRKIQWNFPKYFFSYIFSKSKKTIINVLKSVQNKYFHSNLADFSFITQKCQFSVRKLHFSQFSALLALQIRNFWSFSGAFFLKLGSPPLAEVLPLKISQIKMFSII